MISFLKISETKTKTVDSVFERSWDACALNKIQINTMKLTTQTTNKKTNGNEKKRMKKKIARNEFIQ